MKSFNKLFFSCGGTSFLSIWISIHWIADFNLGEEKMAKYCKPSILRIYLTEVLDNIFDFIFIWTLCWTQILIKNNPHFFFFPLSSEWPLHLIWCAYTLMCLYWAHDSFISHLLYLGLWHCSGMCSSIWCCLPIEMYQPRAFLLLIYLIETEGKSKYRS